MDYYRRTKIFPIMHVLGLARRTLAEAHPWLPAAALLKAFTKSKDMALDLLTDEIRRRKCHAAVRGCEPSGVRGARKMMGRDYWSLWLGRKPAACLRRSSAIITPKACRRAA